MYMQPLNGVHDLYKNDQGLLNSFYLEIMKKIAIKF